MSMKNNHIQIYFTACVDCEIDQDLLDIPFEKASLISIQNYPETAEHNGVNNYTGDSYTSEEVEPENVSEKSSEFDDEEDSTEAEPEEMGEIDSPFYTEMHKEEFINNDTAKNLPPCPEDKIIQLINLFHSINPEAIVLRAMERDIINFCRKLQIGLDKMDLFTKDCDPSKDGILYQQMMKGTHTLSEKVCKDDLIQTEFSQHAKCYNILREDYKDCFGTSGWSESPNSDYVCASYSNITNCFFVKTAHLCGKEAASVNVKLLTLVIDSMLSVKCKGTEQNTEFVKSGGVVFYGCMSSSPYIILLLILKKIILNVN